MSEELKQKPKTKREMALYRGKLTCKIGLEALEGKGMGEGQDTHTILAMALLNVLHALDDIFTVLGEDDE